MAFLQAQLDALEKAISLGALEIEYDDAGGRKRVRYRTLDQMRSLRREMRRELGLDTTDGRTFQRWSSNKGLQ